ncbi:hypothetical protein JZO70_07570 [Enterococcus sp. 669A]|uniref:Aldose 1-epimerase n=1 Tax=Candidatus Enterococcus moelleringii TaxID=2815325 RepID=A0ABS3L8P6_9ENTE|nr:hypothetical protein [Enterococcus sp. 669A]MBO1306014.1 hypothetical protein [Enterococcus sp. 669A]
MESYQIENDQVLIEFLDYGGIITKMINKKTGQNYVLAYENKSDYQANPYFFGATIGRNAGRTFPPFYKNVRGQKIELDRNEGNVHLHGGKNGFHQVQWQVEQVTEDSYQLTYEDLGSPYEPMKIVLAYRLVDNNFYMYMKGQANKPTICNLTNHSYFNLGTETTVEQHLLQTAPATIQLIDEQFVPTKHYSAMDTPEYAPFDFSREKEIQAALNLNTSLSKICADGIDLAYCFTEAAEKIAKIQLTDPQRENKLTIYSDQEACILYTLNKLSDKVKLENGFMVEKYGGVTFEMQRRPNYVHTDADYLVTDYEACTIYEID